MSDGLNYIDPRQKKKEINFHLLDTFQDSADDWRTKTIQEMERWRAENLPHHVESDWSQAKPGQAKVEVRRWLNKNCNDRWAYSLTGVSFESDRDATLFRL